MTIEWLIFNVNTKKCEQVRITKLKMILYLFQVNSSMVLEPEIKSFTQNGQKGLQCILHFVLQFLSSVPIHKTRNNFKWNPNTIRQWSPLTKDYGKYVFVCVSY